MIAVIYCRVSSDRQVKEGHGLDTQEKRCRDYALSKGYEIVAVFKEEGESGGKMDRTAMTQMLNFLEDRRSKNEKTVVIFDDLKRFARDVRIHFALRQLISSKNAIVESPNFKFEDTPEGKFIETMMAAQAELERNQNQRQVIQKMKARLELGYWPFMPPIGLVNKKDPVHGKVLTPNEPYASILKTAIEKYRDGLLLTQEEVRLYLHDEFAMAGLANRLARSTTQSILENPLYAGYIEYPAWKVPFIKARHEGFISLETFTLVQRRLQGRTKPWRRHDTRTEFPLRTFVVCDACNKILTASWNTGNGGRYPNYFCRNKGCMYNWKSINKNRIEPEFETLLLNSKPFDEYIDLANDVFKEQWGMRFYYYTENRNKLRSEVEEINEEIISYFKRIPKTKDEDLIAMYESEIIRLKKEKVQIENNLNIKKYTSTEFGTASDKVLGTLKKPMDMWKSDDYNDKRTVFFMYFEDKLRYDYKKGFGTVDLAYPVKLISEIGQAKNRSVEMSGSEPESE